MTAPLGIIAGGGDLPVRVAEAVAASGRPVVVAVLEGHGDPAAYAGLPQASFRWGLAAQLLAWLRRQGVSQVVLAGTVARPSLLSLRPDAAGLKLLARIGKAAFSGDDSILRAVMKVLAEDGFEILGAQQVLAGLLPSAALLAGPPPDDLACADIRRGLAVCRALGAVDVGQGCIVQQGLVLAVEAIEGTDAMLARAALLRREGPGGVLVKAVKPGQSRLADLPTVGPCTVDGAIAAGLRGLAFEADGTILLKREATIARAAAAGCSCSPSTRPTTWKEQGNEPGPLPAHHDPRRRPRPQREILYRAARHERAAPPRRARRQVHALLPRLWRGQCREPGRDRADLQLRRGEVRAGQCLRASRRGRAGCRRGLREGARGRRQGDARGRAGEVRHHHHRLRGKTRTATRSS